MGHRQTARWLLALSLTTWTAVLPACAADRAAQPDSRNSPSWISSPSRILDEGSTRVLFAVGMAERSANFSMQKVQASGLARNELARFLGKLVEGMVKDYMGTNRDYFQSMDTAASEEYMQDVSREVTDQYVVGTLPWDDYRDPIDNSLFVLYRVELDDVIRSYGDHMSAYFQRELTRKRIQANAGDFGVDLDKQLKKLNAWTAADFDKLLSGL
jgi:hypothetical protein